MNVAPPFGPVTARRRARATLWKDPFPKPLRRLPVGFGRRLGIEGQGEAGVGMTKPGLRRLHVDTFGHEDRGVCSAQVLHPHARQSAATVGTHTRWRRLV